MVCLNHQARLQCIKWHDINLSTHYVRSLKLAINTLKGFDHKSKNLGKIQLLKSVFLVLPCQFSIIGWSRNNFLCGTSVHIMSNLIANLAYHLCHSMGKRTSCSIMRDVKITQFSSILVVMKWDFSYFLSSRPSLKHLLLLFGMLIVTFCSISANKPIYATSWIYLGR